MIDYDKKNGRHYQVRECDYSLLFSSFLKNYFTNVSYIIAPEHVLDDNVKPDFFLVKANILPKLQWFPWLFAEIKDHAKITLGNLLSGQMSRQGDGLFGRSDVPNDTIWAVACIGSHVAFFKYNPIFTPNGGQLVVSYNLLNLAHVQPIDWHFTNMSTNPAI